MLHRLFAFTAVIVAGFLPTARAQDDPFFKKVPNPGESRVRANEMRDGRRVVKGPDEARHKADLLILAKALIYPVTDPAYATLSETDVKKPTELRPVPFDSTINARLEDLDRFVLKPGVGSKLNFDQYDYLIELGVAFDTVLKEVLVPDAPTFQKVNAARMLERVAKTGAPAHAGMITDLIANSETPPELLIYALQAAQGLLAAYDPRQTGNLNYGVHTLKDPDLARLVLAIEKVINRQTPYRAAAVAKPVIAAVPLAEPEMKKDDKTPETKKPDAPQAGKLESSAVRFTPEQGMVIRFLRRQAIRALAQVRYPSITDAKSNQTARPLYTLCRIALNDGPFAPVLGAEEYADALLGLMSQHSLRNVDADVLANCIAIGVGNLARHRLGTADASIHWKLTGVKLNLAVAEWQKLMANNAAMQGAATKLNPLLALVTSQIFTPLEAISKSNPTGGTFNLDGLQNWLEGRTLTGMIPYTDLLDDKAKFTLKPVAPTK